VRSFVFVVFLIIKQLYYFLTSFFARRTVVLAVIKNCKLLTHIGMARKMFWGCSHWLWLK